MTTESDMSELRDQIIRLAYEMPEYQDDLLGVLAENDEDGDDEKEAGVTVRKRRTGPGISTKRNNERRERRRERQKPSVRNREKRLRKKRRNKPRRFRNSPSIRGANEDNMTLRNDLIRLAHGNPGPIRDAVLPLLSKHAVG